MGSYYKNLHHQFTNEKNAPKFNSISMDKAGQTLTAGDQVKFTVDVTDDTGVDSVKIVLKNVNSELSSQSDVYCYMQNVEGTSKYEYTYTITENDYGSTGGNNNQTTTDGNKGNNEGTKLSSDKIQEAVAAINTAKAGDTYTVDMSDATVAPKDVLEAAKGKDVDIVLDMNGYK